MTIAEPQIRPQPSGAAPGFEITETLYSRTDSQGVILAASAALQRVSEQPWEQLIGARHALLRHPEMPRAVYWLLWDRLKAGHSTGAYICNRSRSGAPYWQFQMLAPCEGGYLGIGIRPQGELLDSLQAIYADLVSAEAEGLPPDASAKALIAALRRLGHASYEDFAAAALAQEISLRNKVTGRSGSKRLPIAVEISGLLSQAMAEKQTLLRSFEEIRAIPTNLHIVASRLEVYGGPVSTIAENYRLMSADITRRLEAFAETGGSDGSLGTKMRRVVAEGLFLSGASQLMAEILTHCQSKGEVVGGVDLGVEADRFRAVVETFERDTRAGLIEVGRAALALSAACEEVKRLMLGLDSIRVLSRVEAGRLTRGAEGLQAIILTLDRFHADVGKRLETILNLGRRIRQCSEQALRCDG